MSAIDCKIYDELHCAATCALEEAGSLKYSLKVFENMKTSSITENGC